MPHDCQEISQNKGDFQHAIMLFSVYVSFSAHVALTSKPQRSDEVMQEDNIKHNIKAFCGVSLKQATEALQMPLTLIRHTQHLLLCFVNIAGTLSTAALILCQSSQIATEFCRSESPTESQDLQCYGAKS